MRTELIAMIGADLYCPDCGRSLVKINSDGTADISDRTLLEGTLSANIDEFGELQPPDECIITDARCLRRRCRLRQWIATRRER
jgi:hypothetical protein